MSKKKRLKKNLN